MGLIGLGSRHTRVLYLADFYPGDGWLVLEARTGTRASGTLRSPLATDNGRTVGWWFWKHGQAPRQAELRSPRIKDGRLVGFGSTDRHRGKRNTPHPPATDKGRTVGWLWKHGQAPDPLLLSHSNNRKLIPHHIPIQILPFLFLINSIYSVCYNITQICFQQRTVGGAMTIQRSDFISSREFIQIIIYKQPDNCLEASYYT
jgi:hypothetical protein